MQIIAHDVRCMLGRSGTLHGMSIIATVTPGLKLSELIPAVTISSKGVAEWLKLVVLISKIGNSSKICTIEVLIYKRLSIAESQVSDVYFVEDVCPIHQAYLG